MMKLLLIEDRIDRLRNYTDEKLTESKLLTIVTDTDFTKLSQDFDNKIYDAMSDFHCIMCHRSALSIESRIGLIEKCAELKLPLVFFSGSISANRLAGSTTPVLYMNSKDFYSDNMITFLATVDRDNVINLSILQFGEHWQLNLLLNSRKTIQYRRRSNLPIRIREVNPTVKAMLESDLTWLKGAPTDQLISAQIDELLSKLEVLIFDAL